nr:SDR family NAD(P)-dependent oxidoreductase [Brevibacillus dissolubilis]
MSQANMIRFHTIMRHEDYIVRDHRVHGVRIMPGVTFIDMICRGLIAHGLDPKKLELRNILFKEPIATSEEYDKEIEITVEKAKSGKHHIVTCKSLKVKNGKTVHPDWVENFQCQLIKADEITPPTIDLEALKKKSGHIIDMDTAYSFIRQIDINHFVFMKGLGQIYEGEGYLLAELHLSDLAQSHLPDFYMHPAYLDASTLVPGLFLAKKGEDANSYEMPDLKPSIPMFIESFRSFGSLGEKCYVFVEQKHVTISPTQDIRYVNIDIYDEQGSMKGTFKRLGVKKIRHEGLITGLEKVDGGKGEKAPTATDVTEPSASVTITAQAAQAATVSVSAPVGGAGSAAFAEQAVSEVPAHSTTLAAVDRKQVVERTARQDLSELVAELLGKTADEISTEDGFYDQGLNSGDLLLLVQKLEAKLGEQLYPTLLFEYNTIESLVGYLVEEYAERYPVEVGGAGVVQVPDAPVTDTATATPAPSAVSTTPSTPSNNTLPQVSLQTAIEQDLCVMVGSFVGIPTEEVSVEEGFYNQGLDSGNLLQLVQQLEAKLGEQLYPTLLFEYTTIRDLAGYLVEEFGARYPVEAGSIGGDANLALGIGGSEPSMTTATPSASTPTTTTATSGASTPTLPTAATATTASAVPPAANRTIPSGSLMYARREWTQSDTAAPITAKSSTNTTVPIPEATAGVYLVFTTAESLTDALHNRLSNQASPSATSRVILVKPSASYRAVSDNHYEINPQQPSDYSQLIQDLTSRKLFPTKIVHNLSVTTYDGDPETLRSLFAIGYYSIFYLTQALMAHKPKDRIQMLYLYEPTITQPQFAALAGFARTLRMENPKFTLKTVELIHSTRREQAKIHGADAITETSATNETSKTPKTPTETSQTAEIIVTEFSQTDDETEVRYADGIRYTKSLKEVRYNPDTDQATTTPVPLRPKGVYLITGGAGGLGLIFARYLAEKAQANIVLTGRSQLSSDKEQELQELRSLGADVTYIPTDISDRASVKSLISEIKARHGAIHGIIHAAGVIRDSFIVQKTIDEIETVMGPKVWGSLWLDEATSGDQLDFFVLFSSTAAVIGNSGQSDYSFANSFMDNFAAARTDLGRSGQSVSINWPLWKDGGMHVEASSVAMMKSRTGLTPLSIAGGLQAFEDALRMSGATLTVLEGEIERVKGIIGLTPADVVIDGGKSAATPSLFPAKEAVSPSTNDDIAIIGVSGRYPMASDVAQFWENLKAGKDCITEVPKDRWDHSEYYHPQKNNPGTSYAKWGGFIDDVDKFDPLFFNISPKEAEFMDPQERMFLETVWKTLEDAGYTKNTLGTKQVGVYVGVMWGQYQLLSTEINGRELSPISFYGAIANRVSYYFDFLGPSMAVDTMCSSALTSIHLACESIKRGESDIAIAGGVNITIHPNKYLFLSQATMASTDGRCRSFGEGGDGYVPGEGVGAVLLKPLKKAQQDGDHIYAVIKGSSINSGGKTSGFTVPNPTAQAEVISHTLKKTGIDPRTISYIEAHGTGTSLGDPIEINGLVKAFRPYTSDKQYCAIGSAKSNIGHLESAAGIAAITKVIMQMKHQQLVPSLHSLDLNPNIDFANSPFYVQHELTEWKQPIISENGVTTVLPRRAGVSSFGAGGANAHIILEEYFEPTTGSLLHRSANQDSGDNPATPAIFVLSARNQERLQEYASQLVYFLENTKISTASTLQQIAYTLQTGREAMEERLVIVASSADELLAGLRAYAEGKELFDNIFVGNIKTNRTKLKELGNQQQALIQQAITSNQPAELARLWALGITIDWKQIYPATAIRRIPLPTYPFAKETYWVPDNNIQPGKNRTRGALPTLHPLIDANVSTLDEQVFKKTLTAEEPYVRDHVVNNQLILPGVVYAEMARAAGDLSSRQQKVTSIHNITWTRPLVVQEPTEVWIGLYPNGHEVEFEISTQNRNRVDDERIVHGRGQIRFGEFSSESLESAESSQSVPVQSEAQSQPSPALDLAAIQSRCHETKSGVDCYEAFQQVGFYYGPVFQAIRELSRNEREAVATLSVADVVAGKHASELVLHPSLMDGALQTVAALLANPQLGEGKVYMPYAIGQLDIVRPLSETCYAYVTLADGVSGTSGNKRGDTGSGASEKTFNIQLVDPEGRVLIEMKDFTLREMHAGAAAALTEAQPKTNAEEQQTSDAVGENVASGANGSTGANVASGANGSTGANVASGANGSTGANVVNAANGSTGANATKGAIATTEATTDLYTTQLRAKTESYLKNLLAQETRVQTAKIDANDPMEKYGIDSVMVLSMTRHLEKDFGELSKTLFFEYQTVADLAGYFMSKHHEQLIAKVGAPTVQATGASSPQTVITTGGQATETNPAPATKQNQTITPSARSRFMSTLAASQAQVLPGSQRTYSQDDIAIIGVSGQYPQARDLAQFWENLKSGKDSITEVPSERWDYRKDFDPEKGKRGKSYAKWGGFIEDYDKFDPLFFSISPIEAQILDPQERLFLQTVWKTVEDAGYTRSRLERAKVGVFVGVMYGHYQLYGAEQSMLGNTMAVGSSYASIANRVSYYFNFHGPSLALDTMCSSSLTAIHLACESLRRGESSMAIAGGVNLTIHPNKYILLSQGKFVSTDGHCRSFGEGGDGYVPGEGVGAVLLKPLAQAVQDGDQIYGVIKASSLNHGGKTNGYTVPNPNAQAEVIAETLEKAGIHPRTISYIEAHGTGTQLGDPIEITGLMKAFGDEITDKQYCSIGSVKSNIGHLESAAGIAAVSKVLLQMKHKQLAPSIHSDVLNPNINFADSPFYVQRELAPWNRPVISQNGGVMEAPRRAGISSFGAGGSNVHIILEEYIAPESAQAQAPAVSTDEPTTPQLIVLSARNQERLRDYASDLRAALQTQASTANRFYLPDIAYTLQIGREAMEERLATVVTSTAELIDHLSDYLQGARSDRFVTGNILDAVYNQMVEGEEGQEFIKVIIKNHKLDKLAQLWASGVDINWSLLYPSGTPKVVSLPTYPFAKERFWIPLATTAEQASTQRGGVSKLHPLVDRNASTLREQRFLTTLRGSEYVLADHQINGQPMLPAAAYLEMVHAAGQIAAEAHVLSINNVVLSKPIVAVADGTKEVRISFYPVTEDDVDFEITTDESDGERTLHSYGQIRFVPEGEEVPAASVNIGRLDISATRSRCATTISHEEIYTGFAQAGFGYGPAFRTITELHVGNRECLSRLALPHGLQADFAEYTLHPALMDGALQTVAGLMHSTSQAGTQYLPYAIGSIEVLAPLTEVCFVYVTQKDTSVQAEASSNTFHYDIQLVSATGEALVLIHDFTVKAFQSLHHEKAASHTAASAPKGISDEQLMELLKRVENKTIQATQAEKLMGEIYESSK